MKRMMKKIGALLVGAMLAVSSVAFASNPSPTVIGVVTEVTAVDSTGAKLDLVVEKSDVTATVEEIAASAGVTIDKKLELVSMVEAHFTAEKDIDGTLTLTFKVPNVTSNTVCKVFHFVDGAWKEETSKAGSGQIVVSGVTSLSPFAVLIDKSTLSTTTTTPVTGDNSQSLLLGSVMAAAAVVAAACVIVLVVGKKKRA